MSGRLSGLTAVVTGGADGIGRVTAEVFTREGAAVAIIDRDITRAPLPAFEADVSDRDSVIRAVDAAAERLGGLDILVNNAGIGAIGDVSANDDAEWARVLDVNVTGIARVSATAMPWLRRSASAAIVNVSSVAARNGLPQRALYSASKGAVLALTFAMAADHVREGVRVNCVCPGTVGTAWVERLLATAEDPLAERAALEARQSIGRLVTPEEVAAAILFLAGPESASTTGTALDVDGGLTHLRLRPPDVSS